MYRNYVDAARARLSSNILPIVTATASQERRAFFGPVRIVCAVIIVQVWCGARAMAPPMRISREHSSSDLYNHCCGVLYSARMNIYCYFASASYPRACVIQKRYCIVNVYCMLHEMIIFYGRETADMTVMVICNPEHAFACQHNTYCVLLYRSQTRSLRFFAVLVSEWTDERIPG